MNDKEFNPYVRFINKRSFLSPYPEMVYAYDFRMLYLLAGTIKLELENDTLQLAKEDLVTLPPGTAYRLIKDSNDAIYYIVNFNFDYVYDGQEARPPVSKKDFDKNEIFSLSCIKPFDKLFILHNANIAKHILEEISHEHMEQSIHSNRIQSALMKYLLTKLGSYHTSKKPSSKAEMLISDIKKYIAENHTCVNNQTVADTFGYHPHHLNSLFLKAENITMHKYIDEVRLKYAKEMLLTTNKPIYEVAYNAGFSDASYFCKFFFRLMNMTPKEYRNLTR